MALRDDAAKLETRTKLANSRAEIRRVLEPAPRVPRDEKRHPEHGENHRHVEIEEEGDPHAGVFPRSRTMRLLISGRSMGTVGAVLGGLVIARPALAFKLIRMFPTGAVARMLMLKAVAAFRSRH